MTFDDLPDGAFVFLDANPLVYYFSQDPSHHAPSERLVERIAKGLLVGLTTTHILSEMAHRLMTLEAVQGLGWPPSKVVNRLRQHPAEIAKLVGFRRAVEFVPRLGIHVLAIDLDRVAEAALISQQYGLLSNDALLVAVMEHCRITDLASNDTDFDRVPSLRRYATV